MMDLESAIRQHADRIYALEVHNKQQNGTLQRIEAQLTEQNCRFDAFIKWSVGIVLTPLFAFVLAMLAWLVQGG